VLSATAAAPSLQRHANPIMLEEILLLMLDRGVNINERFGSYEETALMIGCDTRNLSLVQVLLNKGADVK
jgi:ankyrin repeat protein